MPRKCWSATETAQTLGISDRHLRRLVADGVLTPGERGFDPIPTLLAYLKHVTKDVEGRRARTALMQVEVRRKNLTLRRHLGEMLTAAERETLDDQFFDLSWQAWQVAASVFFDALGSIPDLDPRERLRLANIADQAGKAQLIDFRDHWRHVLRTDVRPYLRDPERIDKLAEDLSASTDQADPAQKEDDDA